MEMVSMARQVLFLSSICLILVACQSKNIQETLLKVHESDAAFSRNQGQLFYMNQLFSGIQFAVFTNGDTARITHFKEGKEQGSSKVWYENGQLAEQRFYNKGKKEGIHRAWWLDGKPRFEYHFKNDEHHEVQRDWFPNGRLAEVFHYQNGHEEGPQQMWFDDGTLKANYVIKDGRRYGLPGVKNCVSVVENNIFQAKK